MFGCRHHGREERFAAGGRGEFGGGFGGGWGRGRRGGGGGFGGGGGGDFFRIGRMLAQGDLKLLALSLIAEQPRHGYEIIKLIEEKTGGWYSPSPGVVYPTLTFLEEAGYVTAEPDGAKKRFTITEEGRAYLEENKDVADALVGRLSEIGLKVGKMRRWMGKGEEGGEPSGLPRLVDAAIENLKDVAKAKLAENPRTETRIVEILAGVANDLREV
ncbi:PadR family transcriptional regulator [Azorhizobium sp. AG788]|uniref:PadR family transcriptional regulator n=1 Tax=Azorhizobium sp. AG788 TaxID=2183897 RepID=UPI001061FC13|nr:PadR family transcriptional regulator [Azorhizobium sp. AG788]TDU00704.1 PadR family transcriptional regulator [Azorhizobium sp. AG788]